MSQFYSFKILAVSKAKKETNFFLKHIWNENSKSSGASLSIRRWMLKQEVLDSRSRPWFALWPVRGRCQISWPERKWGQVVNVQHFTCQREQYSCHLIPEWVLIWTSQLWPLNIVSFCTSSLPISSFPDYPVNKQKVPRSEKTHPNPEVTPPARK